MRAERRVKLICLSLSIIAMATATLLHKPQRSRAAHRADESPKKTPSLPRDLEHLPDVYAILNEFDLGDWDLPEDAAGVLGDDSDAKAQRYGLYRRVVLLSDRAIPFPQGPGTLPPLYAPPPPYERPELARLTVWLDPYQNHRNGAGTAGFSTPAVMISRGRAFETPPALSLDGFDLQPGGLDAPNLPPPGDFSPIPEPAMLAFLVLAAAFCPRRA